MESLCFSILDFQDLDSYFVYYGFTAHPAIRGEREGG